jgi:hypothetical protein
VVRVLRGVLVAGIVVACIGCGGSGDGDDAPSAQTPAVEPTPTPDVFATATAFTAGPTPTPIPTIAGVPDAIPNTPAGKQLAWVMQFFFAIDPTQLDPADITPRFTDAFLAALPVDRLTASIQTFKAQHGDVTFTGFVAPPADTELAGYLMTTSGKRFIIRIRVESVAPYRMALFRIEPAPN